MYVPSIDMMPLDIPCATQGECRIYSKMPAHSPTHFHYVCKCGSVAYADHSDVRQSVKQVGQYSLKDFLGSGGMGVVFRGVAAQEEKSLLTHHSGATASLACAATAEAKQFTEEHKHVAVKIGHPSGPAADLGDLADAWHLEGCVLYWRTYDAKTKKWIDYKEAKWVADFNVETGRYGKQPTWHLASTCPFLHPEAAAVDATAFVHCIGAERGKAAGTCAQADDDRWQVVVEEWDPSADDNLESIRREYNTYVAVHRSARLAVSKQHIGSGRSVNGHAPQTDQDIHNHSNARGGSPPFLTACSDFSPAQLSRGPATTSSKGYCRAPLAPLEGLSNATPQQLPTSLSPYLAAMLKNGDTALHSERMARDSISTAAEEDNELTLTLSQTMTPIMQHKRKVSKDGMPWSGSEPVKRLCTPAGDKLFSTYRRRRRACERTSGKLSGRASAALRARRISFAATPSKCGIPQVYGWGVTATHFGVQPWMAMQLLSGTNLHDCIYDDPTTPYAFRDEFPDLAHRMLGALQLLHDAGWVHHDIKPAQYCFGASSECSKVYLVDLGFCIPSSNALSTPTAEYFQGTPDYASDRMLKLCTPTPADDLESLAYAYMEMWWGTLPWDVTNTANGRLRVRDWHKWYPEMIKVRQATLDAAAAEGLMPAFLSHMLGYTRSFSNTGRPDYKLLHGLIAEGAKVIEQAPHMASNWATLRGIGLLPTNKSGQHHRTNEIAAKIAPTKLSDRAAVAAEE